MIHRPSSTARQSAMITKSGIQIAHVGDIPWEDRVNVDN